MSGMDLDTYRKLPSLGPLVMVELRAIHLHRHLQKSPLTVEVAGGECRIAKSLTALARKAHANLLGGAECPSRGTLKAVLQALAGVDDMPSEADTTSQGGEPTEAVEALCDKLAADALSKVESMLLNAVRARYAHEKDRMVESALQAIADEG